MSFVLVAALAASAWVGAPTAPVDLGAEPQAVAEVIPAPEPPPGTNQHTQMQFVKVSRLLQAGQWAEAAEAAKYLPSRTVKLEWIDADVPTVRRAELRRAVEKALETWRNVGVQVTWATPGDVRVAFTNDLPVDPDSNLPAGAAFFITPEALPRVEAVVALNRNQPLRSVEGRDVANEVIYAVGLAIGMERRPRAGSVMWRQDASANVLHQAGPQDIRTGSMILDAADRLREAVAKRQRVSIDVPVLFLDPPALTASGVGQGDQLSWTVQVVNRGRSTLRLQVVPDCACFTLIRFPATVEPGASALMSIESDTTEFPGPFRKSLYVYSNDPEAPVRRITATTEVRPAYRFLAGRLIESADGKPTAYEVILTTDPEAGINPVDVAATGAPATVTIEPWRGTLPDEEMNEGPKERSGYRLRVSLGPDLPAGRTGMSLSVQTNHPVFKVVRHGFSVQEGLVASPVQVYLGEVGKEPSRAWFLVQGTGKPFKVTKVETDHEALSAFVDAVLPNGQVKVVVQYNGKALHGVLTGNVRVHTDSARQPMLNVPVRGVVR